MGCTCVLRYREVYIPWTKLETRCELAFADRWQGKSSGKVSPMNIPFLSRSGLAISVLNADAKCFSTPASKKKHLHR